MLPANFLEQQVRRLPEQHEGHRIRFEGQASGSGKGEPENTALKTPDLRS
jgi:hypothetical protein